MDTYLAIASKRDWRRYSERPLDEEVERRILDAGRLAGSAMNKQPWTFLVASPETKERLVDVVYAPDNVRSAALVVAIATETGGWGGFDAARAAQNMMLAAWNDGVASCPNGIKDVDDAAAALGLAGGETVAVILSFGYPTRALTVESRSADGWSRDANRRPLEDVVRRV